MEKLTGCGKFLENSKPYCFAMISLQFGYAGMNIITKVSLNRGMSHHVLVVYRHAIATAVIAPFAFCLQWKRQPKINLSIFMQIFVLGLFWPVIDQNFYYTGLKYTSPTFSCAVSNMLPAMTFIMAVIFRMEKIIDLKKVRCQAKIVGTALSVAGTMLMTLYKGLVQRFNLTNHCNTGMGAALFVLQSHTLKTYKNHQLSLTSLICFMGTLQAIAVTFVMEHDMSVWQIGWDMNLLAAAYAVNIT
uniref:WAT1-related protein n=1 Tax=Kalanchoe fedtschenkoi TaxID=63787 RepID=A0A7N0TRI5_KALFE